MYKQEVRLELEIRVVPSVVFSPDLSSAYLFVFFFTPLSPTQRNVKSLQTTCLVNYTLSILSQSRKTFADPDV